MQESIFDNIQCVYLKSVVAKLNFENNIFKAIFETLWWVLMFCSLYDINLYTVSKINLIR